LQTNPSLAPAGVLAALAESAVDMDSPFTAGFDIGFDAATGYGLVDALGALGKVIDVTQLVGLHPNEYIVVNVTNDALDTNPDPNIIDVSAAAGNQVSLRAAIVNANLSTSTQKTILAPRGTYTLTLPGTGGDAQGDLDITGVVTVIGAGAGMAVINATGLNDRIFDVSTAGVALNLARLTLTGGNVVETLPGSNGGGAILAKAGTTVDLNQVALVGNTSNTFGGAVRVADSSSHLKVRNSVVTGNTANNSGGGIAVYTPGTTTSRITIANTILADNTQVGGIYHNLYSDSLVSNEGYNLVDDNAGTYFTAARGNHIGSVHYVVTGVEDTFDGSSDPLVMSVRDAMHLANTTAGTQEIWVPGWHFVLTLAGTGAISQGDLDISSAMVVRGVAAGQTIIDAGGYRLNESERIFDVENGGTLDFSRVKSGCRHGDLFSHWNELRHRTCLRWTSLKATWRPHNHSRFVASMDLLVSSGGRARCRTECLSCSATTTMTVLQMFHQATWTPRTILIGIMRRSPRTLQPMGTTTVWLTTMTLMSGAPISAIL
jgi:hypothetical protein